MSPVPRLVERKTMKNEYGQFGENPDFTGFKITTRRDGVKVTVTIGEVLSAYNYGNERDGDNWYIEFLRVEDGGYGYYKQKYDGGSIEYPEDLER